MTVARVLDHCYPTHKHASNIDSSKGEFIHTWYLPNGGETHLIRHDDKIEVLTIQGEIKTNRFTHLADIPSVFSSPEEFIETMIAMDPMFNPNG